MNNARRKIIASSIVELKAILSKLAAIKEEEQAAANKFQENDDKIDAVNIMEDLISNLDESISGIQSTIDTLEGADF